MTRIVRRGTGLALAAVFALSIGAAPTSAVTVQRTWSAAVGTGGAYGSAVLRAYTNGTGLLSLDLRSLHAGTAYSVVVRSGRCSRLGTALASFVPVTPTTAGTVVTPIGVSGAKMNAIWRVARTGSVAITFGSGSLLRCGSFSYPVATRIVISSLAINLAIVPGPSGYPYCNVAMYMQQLYQPREPGVSLIYAHARRGMFLPLLTRSKINNGASLIGMRVLVYTSDSRVSTYQIIQVKRHQTSIASAFSTTAERLWLYTSEGPNFRYPKLIVIAKRLSTTTTSHAASHPRARPISC